MALLTESSLRSMLGKGLPNPFPIRDGDKLTPAASDFLRERSIALQRIAELPNSIPSDIDSGYPSIPVGVSNLHVHLSPEHVEALFGAGYRLKPLRELSQKGEYAAHETVTLIGPKGSIPNTRILGPSRGATQVEISRSDGFRLGVSPSLRLSGDIQGTPGIQLNGPAGNIMLQEGLIAARNHVHLSPEDARKLGVEQGNRLILQTLGDRPVIFPDVIARISSHYSLDFHVDLDEANAAFLDTGDTVQLVGKNGQLSKFVKGGQRRAWKSSR
ncbi:phosphate propanoyltransferase [Cohnella luojiensis]|uniref:Phosphate propanoyltransferase n=1 Tax=Cohnella luojiensis TaxID=652876 RepID=A0A4Y8LT41_9BACL|nr:phosphate propanoyltransferase [Cohnella luojiensis]TFE23551.1 phosphate propanoyltransferase [Cohnella luojiensis]